MDKTDIIDVNEKCDSPVYVETSPVSSPVFISKNDVSLIEPSSDITQKLILPLLDTTTITIVTDENDKNVSKDFESPSTKESEKSSSNNVNVSENTVSSVAVNNVVKDFNYCKEEFLKQVNENNISVSPDMIMRLLRIAMVIVEQTKESGSNKKEFVINLLKEVFLNNNYLSTEHKLEALNLITNGVVSESIDIIIEASKGKFDLNKVEKVVEEVAKSCFTRCFEKLLKKK
jgi:hypothetical protein